MSAVTRLASCVAVLLVSALAPAAASAQACTGGREAGPETLGRCCWPGQSFSEEHGRCFGPPRCPAGLAAEGDACVSVGGWAPPAPQAQLGSPLTPALPPAPLSWPLVSPDIGVGVVNPRLAHTEGDTGFVIAGVTVLATGYVVGILAAVFDQLGWSCSSGNCNSWPLGFVPIVGGALAGTVSFSGFRYSSGWGLGMGVPAAIVQSAGVTFLLVGLLLDREELVPSMEAGNAIVHVAPFASPEAGGVSLTVEL